jgi:hypothetical protein
LWLNYKAVFMFAACLMPLFAAAQAIQQESEAISIDWGKSIAISQSTPTLQLGAFPVLRQGSPLHDSSFAALKQLGADYVRYVPWLPYPRLGVAELEPPTRNSTSWNFSLLDPMMKDFMAATRGHSTIMNFSTIPVWLFKTSQPVKYPPDPNQVFWDYTQGTELKDPSGRQLGEYYARLVNWYTRGGFTDENGKLHTSGYHYSFPIWEVLNEPDSEHHTTPEQYTQRYDAIVSAIHKVSPESKFMGLALAGPQDEPRWFEYFLDHSHHKPGIPLDYISYHFYATPAPGQDINNWQYTFFDQADRFLSNVGYIEVIRKRLSPETKTDTDELGTILPTDFLDMQDAKAHPDNIPPLYWNASGALYAYLFIGLSKQGINIIGESQLNGYPSQFRSVTMVDWENGKPNARFWILKIIKDNFHSGDRLVETKLPQWSQVEGQAFATAEGRKLLLINKRNSPAEVTLPQSAPYTLTVVDEQTGENNPRVTQEIGTTLKLAPFAVAVLTWNNRGA